MSEATSNELVQRIEDCLLRPWMDRVASERAARGLLREAADALRAAQPPAATHTQWQRDRLATCLVKHKPALPDHACAQCVPGGEIVVEDFECCYHMLYDKLITDVENALKSPEPASAQETIPSPPPPPAKRLICEYAPGFRPKSPVESAEPTYECINEECGWVGLKNETVHPKHDATSLRCPECHEVVELDQPAQNRGQAL